MKHAQERSPARSGSAWYEPLLSASTAQATPAFWVSAPRIRHNYRRMIAGLPGVRVFYPVKTNPNREVLQIVREEGASFDAASLGEVELVLSLDVPANRIAFTTPVKAPNDIAAAARAGVRLFAADSDAEIGKLATHAPGAQVLIRIRVPSSGSQWPLSRRFGVAAADAGRLLTACTAQGLEPLGTTFHVGSQCTATANWREAVRAALSVLATLPLRADGRGPVLDLGGGYPVAYTEAVPALEEIFAVVREELADSRHGTRNLRLWVEPGRAMVADAAVAVASVIGRTRRNCQDWLFLDLGAFNGLLELIEPSSRGFGYRIAALTKDGKQRHGAAERSFAISGPSCDDDDIIGTDVPLPADLDVGDRLAIFDTGAYTFAYASGFCSNRPAAVHVVDGE
jgi:ornithine decarboxylase